MTLLTTCINIRSMKRKILFLQLLLIIALSGLCAGCASGGPASDAYASRTTGSDTSTEASLADEITVENSITLEGRIDTEQILEGGTITVPSYLQGDETRELTPTEESGSDITYELNNVQQSELVNQTTAQLQSSITEVLSDKKNYPHITKISVNESCSEFTVLFTSHELTLYETTLRLSLYLAGDKYQLYSGTPENALSTIVHYTDASTGEVFLSGTSSELRSSTD